MKNLSRLILFGLFCFITTYFLPAAPNNCSNESGFVENIYKPHVVNFDVINYTSFDCISHKGEHFDVIKTNYIFERLLKIKPKPDLKSNKSIKNCDVGWNIYNKLNNRYKYNYCSTHKIKYDVGWLGTKKV